MHPRIPGRIYPRIKQHHHSHAHLATQFHGPLESIRLGPPRAYAGWLLTMRQFLVEHASVVSQLREAFHTNAIPQPVIAKHPAGPTSVLQMDTNEAAVDAVQQLRKFCGRWRLSSLWGPLLPLPVGPQAPALFPVASIQQALPAIRVSRRSPTRCHSPQ